MSGILIKNITLIGIPYTLFKPSPIVPDRGTSEKGESNYG